MHPLGGGQGPEQVGYGGVTFAVGMLGEGTVLPVCDHLVGIALLQCRDGVRILAGTGQRGGAKGPQNEQAAQAAAASILSAGCRDTSRVVDGVSRRVCS